MSQNYMGSFGSGNFGADRQDDPYENEDPNLTQREWANIGPWGKLVLQLLDDNDQVMLLGDLAADLRTYHCLRGPAIDEVIRQLEIEQKVVKARYNRETWVQTCQKPAAEATTTTHNTWQAGSSNQQQFTHCAKDYAAPYTAAQSHQTTYQSSHSQHGAQPTVQRTTGFMPTGHTTQDHGRTQQWAWDTTHGSSGSRVQGYGSSHVHNAGGGTDESKHGGSGADSGQYGHWS